MKFINNNDIIMTKGTKTKEKIKKNLNRGANLVIAGMLGILISILSVVVFPTLSEGVPPMVGRIVDNVGLFFVVVGIIHWVDAVTRATIIVSNNIEE